MTPQHKTDSGGRGIEWTSFTWNPVGGCQHACRWQMPDGNVAQCYAETQAEGPRMKKVYNNGFAAHYWRPHMLNEPSKVKEPSLIFNDSMADLFGHWVPDDQIRQVLRVIADNPRHTFQSLTKAPARLLKFINEFPNNMWVGVSSPPDFMMGNELSQSQKERMLARSLDVLAQVRDSGRVVWMSIEPLSWDVAPLMADHPLSWAVIGAATNGPKKFQPNPHHVSTLLDVLDKTQTPVFFKGNLDWSPRREDFPVVPGWDAAVRRREAMAEQYGWTRNRFLAPPEENQMDDPEMAALFGVAAAPVQMSLL